MKLIDEFRDPELCRIVLEKIRRKSSRSITIMEVCGGHTMALNRFGIPSLLPDTINLISGPGCPVCVTGRGYIDNAIDLALRDNTMVCTYGDLLRVPGSESTLEKAQANGGNVRIVYSPTQCLDMAEHSPETAFIFLGIGFETTAPASAVTLRRAKELGLRNFFLYSAHKTMPRAMASIIHAGVKVDAYLCPGHVSTITGIKMYEPLVEQFGVGCVVSGFEPLDLLQSILMLVEQYENKGAAVEIQYTRAVRPEGNLKAQKIMNEVFEASDAWWRGLGVLKYSGLKPSPSYNHFDASEVFGLTTNEPADPPGCRCGDVLKGLLKPVQCKLFGIFCSPANPIGACMVSAEGACQSHFRYANT